MVQQGQVFKPRTKCADGKGVWAYRYRLKGHGSTRPGVGGSRLALTDRRPSLGPVGRGAALTLAELIDEYLHLAHAEENGAGSRRG